MLQKLSTVVVATALVTSAWTIRTGIGEGSPDIRFGPQRASAAVAGIPSAVIYDNIALGGGINAAGSAPASQLDAQFPFDAGSADDFVLGESPSCLWSIEGVRFRGEYWNDTAPGGVQSFRVIFWPDTADGPAGRAFGPADTSEALAIYEIPGSGNETGTTSPSAFDYELVLPAPLSVAPGEKLWIQIQAVMPFPPQWGVAVTSSQTGSGPQEYFDLLAIPAWMPIADAGDLAFQLLGRPAEINCDDGNACTTDSCDDATCIHTPLSCDDGNACTADSCDPAGGCVNESITCDDGNACTTDSCDPATGCTTEPISCDDGDACTTDTCDPASGCSTEPVVCDDGNACTTDSCDSSTGCVTSPVTCDDGDACTTDTCDPTSGCNYAPVDCDDGDGCTTDTCVNGTCQFAAPPDFDGDGDVDLTDANAVLSCIAGSEQSCDCVDLSGDGKTDLHDFYLVQQMFTGGN